MSDDPHWTLSTNNVIITYPPLAGGDFIQNMLGYYRSFMSRLPVPANGRNVLSSTEHAKNRRFLDEMQHHHVMYSLPSYDIRSYWHIFDGTANQFIGFCMHDVILRKIPMGELLPFTEELLKYYYIIYKTGVGCVDDIRAHLPNCTIISLVDAAELREIAKTFKPYHDKYILADSQYLIDTHLEGDNVYNFSMKNVFNKELFFHDLSDLAMKISGNCTYSPLMEEYYDAYIAVHK